MKSRIGLRQYGGFLALCLVACSGEPSFPGQNQVGGMHGGGASNIVGTGGAPAIGGASATQTGGVTATGGASAPSGGSSSTLVNCGTDPILTLVTNASTVGTGACANVSLGSFLSAIRAQNSQILATLLSMCPMSGTIGASSAVYAYRTSCGSFRVVVWQGSGDCPAGCINNDYWYFDSNTNCQPVEVRHTRNSNAGCSW